MPEQAEQILTELTRAGTRPPVHGALDLLLHSHLPDLLTAAIAAAAGRLPDLLDHAVQLAPQPAQAARLAAQMPEHSVQLAALAATLTSQQVSQYRADALSGEPDAVNRLAESLTNLSRRLAALGRREEALAASQEAVTIRRGPAAPRPDAFRPHLAASLHSLAADLAALGRREEALAAIQEAVTIRRELAARWPDKYRPELEQSLRVVAWLESGRGLRDASPQSRRRDNGPLSLILAVAFRAARPTSPCDDQELTWAQIGELLGTTAATAARRYRNQP